MHSPGEPSAVNLHRSDGRSPVVLVCEHASAIIPLDLDGLGLSKEARLAHVAWDIGALDVAMALSAQMDAPLVAGGMSRLVYDCNRPPDSPSAIPARSEIYDIPGNANLTQATRQQRCDMVHDPFHATLSKFLEGRPDTTALITVHSFTPVFHGERRTLDIGFLHDSAARLAETTLQIETARGQYECALNAPYAASDGVTYTLQKHAESRGIDALMIEVRNDLIANKPEAEAMASHLAETLSRALAQISEPAA